jgi:hypothetical protein
MLVVLLRGVAYAVCRHTPCTGEQRSSDAIIFVAQKKHSTYDSSHNSFGNLVGRTPPPMPPPSARSRVPVVACPQP